jgi:hypothetical protein
VNKVRWVVCMALLTVFLAGCVPGGQRSAVVSVATRFVADVSRHDGSAACAILTDDAKSSASGATDTPCGQAVLNVKENGTTIRGVQVWGDTAQVKIGGDVLFLRRLKSGWRVNAAGCKPQPRAAYQCDVAG